MSQTVLHAFVIFTMLISQRSDLNGLQKILHYLNLPSHSAVGCVLNLVGFFSVFRQTPNRSFKNVIQGTKIILYNLHFYDKQSLT